MERAEAFQQLAALALEIDELTGKLFDAHRKEKELYALLNLPHPSDHKKPERKTHITKDQAIEIRRKIMSVMRNFKSKGLTWVPMGVIVKHTNQELPEALEQEIETQVRYLAKAPEAAIEHNGSRGHGSAYTYTGELNPQQ